VAVRISLITETIVSIAFSFCLLPFAFYLLPFTFGLLL